MRTVYLAGPINGQTFEEATAWRYQMRQWLNFHLHVLDPMRGKDHLQAHDELGALGYEENLLSSEEVIFKRDRDDVKRSDIVLVNFLSAKQVSVGSCIEMGWADAWDKTMIIVLPEGSVYDHIFTRQIRAARVSTLEDATIILHSMA